MFKKAVVLSSKDHGNLFFKAEGGFSFAAKTHAFPICATEFYFAAKEYPIVFGKNNEDFTPVIIAGLRENENLFVTNDGIWSANYIPALVRAYPFGFVDKQNDKDSSIVLIDEEYPGFNQNEGIALFNKEGEMTEDLKQKLVFLKDYRNQIKKTNDFVAALKDNDLLIEKSAQFDSKENPTYQIQGMWVIDEQKLYALSDEKLLDFAKKGYIALATAHLMSLQSLTNVYGKAKSMDSLMGEDKKIEAKKTKPKEKA